ncbi:MAG TPA: P1 family peptidase [Gaiellales bacterium]|jgi:D-aminopeptidase
MSRLRELGLSVGLGTPGPLNAITDVEGVRVGHATIVRGDGALEPGVGPVRTGVTIVRPRPGPAWCEPAFAGAHRLNGNGEMTGLEWIREAGTLTSEIGITNTHSVGVVRDELCAIERRERGPGPAWSLPVVGETWDGVLSDVDGQHVAVEHVREALASARSGPVPEGAVGGGTGMICHGFKGGIGTASRVLERDAGGYTVGVLVQANHGRRQHLCVDGAHVGRVLGADRVPLPGPPPEGAGSIIVIVATDAPLLPGQCDRLAQRATIGVARAGGGCEDSSGDLFLCFATGNRGLPSSGYDSIAPLTSDVRTVSNPYMTPLFDAVAEATEEAILNALLAAETMTGRDGVTAYALAATTLLQALRA